MNENEVSHESSPVNLDNLRLKLQALLEAWTEKLPSLIVQSKDSTEMTMTEKMLLNSFRPFLPKLQDSLMSKIDSLTDDELLLMIEKVESAWKWLLND